jgi:TolB-like protein
MQIEFMWKTKDSAVENCPALYRAPGGYVVQGKMLDAETRAALRQLAGDEDAVFVPADVIDRIKGL